MDSCARRRWDLVRRGLAQEEGFGLIEVLASAVVVVIVAIGVFAGLDAASATSGTSKARAMASALAQEDQERMRGLPVGDLSNLRATRTETRADADYTVVSRTDWITDRNGGTSCTSDATASYLKITSTVTWNEMRGVAPVRAQSLVAPPVGSFGPGDGSLALEVLDRNAVGVRDVSVTLSGPRSGSESTNELGCVFWGNIPVGQYGLDFAAPGYVTPEGENAVSVPAEVIGEAVSTKSVRYDRAGSVTVNFDTRPLGAPAPQPDEGDVVTFANGGLAAGSRPFGTVTATSVQADGVFPFNDPYRIYSGTCLAADPATHGRTPSTVTIAPGGTATVTVREPSVNVRALAAGLAPVQGARVRVMAVDRTAGPDAATGRYPADPACGPGRELTTDATGRLPKPGLPYGVYEVCVSDATRHVLLPRVANTSPNGTPLLPVVLTPAFASPGACP